MSTTLSLSTSVRANVLGKNYGFNYLDRPVNITLSSDTVWTTVELCAVDTQVNLYSNTSGPSTLDGYITGPTFAMFIPNVDGNFSWSSSSTSYGSVSLAWKAGVPLIFGRVVTTEYNATPITRNSSSEVDIQTVDFYNTGTEDGYVEVFVGK